MAGFQQVRICNVW